MHPFDLPARLRHFDLTSMAGVAALRAGRSWAVRTILLCRKQVCQPHGGWVDGVLKTLTRFRRERSSAGTKAPVRFVVIAFGRSGSTFLVDLLRSHPDVTCYHEPFNIGTPHRPFDGPEDRRTLVRELYEVGLSGGPRKYAKPVPHYGQCGAVGFKVTVGQLLHPEAGLTDWFVSEPGLRVVVLRRRSILRRYVSYRFAEQRRQWHSRSKGAVVSEGIRIPPAGLQKFVDNLAREEATLTELLQSAGHAVLDVDYEDLVEDRKAVVDGVVRFLGLAPAPDYSAITVKLAPGRLATLITNYEEIRRAFPNLVDEMEA